MSEHKIKFFLIIWMKKRLEKSRGKFKQDVNYMIKYMVQNV